MTDLSAPFVIGLAVLAAVLVWWYVDRRLGRDADLEGTWFPANHWHVAPRSPFDEEPGDWRS